MDISAWLPTKLSKCDVVECGRDTGMTGIQSFEVFEKYRVGRTQILANVERIKFSKVS